MAEVKKLDIVKKAARAVTYLDIELLDMGDSHKDIVGELCYSAGVEFDTDSDEYEEDEHYLEKKSVESYEILFTEKRGSYENSICEYYCDCKGALISGMKYVKGSKVEEHPTYKALLDFYTYIEPLEEKYCKNEWKGNLKSLLDGILEYDMELISISYQISSEYWRHLDEKYFYRSNTYYRVGDVVVYDEDELSSLGQYVAHAMMNNGRKYGYSDCGFSVVFKKEHGNIVACLFEQKKKQHEDPYSYKDVDVKVMIDKEDITGSAKRLAETINKLTLDMYPELNIPRYFIIHVKSGKSIKEGYCRLARVIKGSVEEIHIFLNDYGYFVHEDDKNEVCYVAEIEEEEYLTLKQNADVKIGYGCMLDRKIFSNEDVFKLKNICFKNSEDKDSSYGFEFMGQWVVNPFMDVSDRFELKDLNEVYDYYSKDSDGMYDIESYTRLYDFLNEMLKKS